VVRLRMPERRDAMGPRRAQPTAPPSNAKRGGHVSPVER
jgi:hypothetical protein